MLRDALKSDLSQMWMWWPTFIPVGEWIQVKIHAAIPWSPHVASQMSMLPELRATRFLPALRVISLAPAGEAVQKDKGLDFRLCHCWGPPSGLNNVMWNYMCTWNTHIYITYTHTFLFFSWTIWKSVAVFQDSCHFFQSVSSKKCS